MSGQIVIRPLRNGVRQEPPLPLMVELQDADNKSGLAEAIEQALHAQAC